MPRERKGLSRSIAFAYEVAASGIRSIRNDGFVNEEIPKRDRPIVRALLGQLAYDLLRKAGVRACRVCGCSEEDPCDAGCSWVGLSLCSACAPAPRRKAHRHALR